MIGYQNPILFTEYPTGAHYETANFQKRILHVRALKIPTKAQFQKRKSTIFLPLAQSGIVQLQIPNRR